MQGGSAVGRRFPRRMGKQECSLEDVPLSASQTSEFAAAAELWSSTCLPDVPGSECDAFAADDFATVDGLLEGYAGFHAHALAVAAAGGPTPPTLRFVPNQFGLGNRLRAMKSALLIAMLTGGAATRTQDYASALLPDRWRCDSNSTLRQRAVALRSTLHHCLRIRGPRVLTGTLRTRRTRDYASA